MSIVPPQMPVEDVMEISYKDSVTTTDGAKARYLLETLGPRITAVGVGLRDARQAKAWAEFESVPRGDNEDRLRILFRVADAISKVYGARTAAAFVRGANPGLDDESVLSILSSQKPTAQLEKRLMGVVRDFLAG